MANTKSAEKRARQTARRTVRNRSVRTRLRRMQKQASSAGSNRDAASLSAVISEIDRAAKRGIIHKNAANRRKARLKKVLGASSAAA